MDETQACAAPTTSADPGFRVTVEDLKTGGSQTMICAPGDMMLIPFAPCYKHSSQHHANGTTIITVRDHRPQFKARSAEVDGAETFRQDVEADSRAVREQVDRLRRILGQSSTGRVLGLTSLVSLVEERVAADSAPMTVPRWMVQGLPPERHVAEFRADGWTIMHPLTCRSNLFDCPVNRAGQGLAGPPVLGRYVVGLIEGELSIGPPADDATRAAVNASTTAGS